MIHTSNTTLEYGTIRPRLGQINNCPLEPPFSRVGVYNLNMNNNIFITNESARKDPVVIAAMKSILAQMTAEQDRRVAGIAPDTVEVSPVNFLQDVMDDLGDPQCRNREREEYFRNGWGDSVNGCWQ